MVFRPNMLRLITTILKCPGFSSKKVRYPRYQDTNLLQLCLHWLWFSWFFSKSFPNTMTSDIYINSKFSVFYCWSRKKKCINLYFCSNWHWKTKDEHCAPPPSKLGLRHQDKWGHFPWRNELSNHQILH